MTDLADTVSTYPRLVLALALLTLASVARGQPDVLLITIDDLNDWVGVMGGHPQAKTPNIDRLAARGMLFTNAHAASTTCNPSRTALMTGLRPSTTGVYTNAHDWRVAEELQGIPTFPRYFRDQGYQTLGAGKLFHAHTWSYSGLAGYNDTAAWDAFYPSAERQLPDEVSVPDLNRPVNKNPGFLGFDWSGLVTEDWAMGDGQVVSWAEQQLMTQGSRPRFMAVGIFRPHLPWYVPQKYFDMHPLDTIELPPVTENDLDDLPNAASNQQPGRLQQLEMHDWVLGTTGAWRAAVQGYLASVSFADAMVGQLLDALDRSDRADETIVILLTDHGYHLGEKKRWRKYSLWEESTRVPLIVVAPGVTRPGTRTDQVVSLMDVYPTLTELAGLPSPPHLEGTSLRPLLENPDNTPWDHAAITTYQRNNHAVRTDRYRYIRYADGTEELYDHTNDPYEWTNLAGDPSFSALKDNLARWLPQKNVMPANGG